MTGPEAAADVSGMHQNLFQYASPLAPNECAVISRDLQQQRALEECTFVPRLNAKNTSRSIVAQCWQGVQCAHQHAAQHQLHTAAVANASGTTEAAQSQVAAAGTHPQTEAVGEDGKVSVGNQSQAVVAEQPDLSNSSSPVMISVQQAAQKTQQNSAGVASSKASKHVQRGKLDTNSYAAVAQRSKGQPCILCSPLLAQLQPEQPKGAGISSAPESEAQLHADVLECDKQLVRCAQAQRQSHACQQAALNGSAKDVGHKDALCQPDVSSAAEGGQSQPSALRVALEAELQDGSTSRFEVQQVPPTFSCMGLKA